MNFISSKYYWTEIDTMNDFKACKKKFKKWTTKKLYQKYPKKIINFILIQKISFMILILKAETLFLKKKF